MPFIKPEYKDLAVFFTIALTCIKFNIWSMVIPYYYSYVKHYNPSVTMKTVFNGIVCIYFGSSVSTLTFPTLLFVLGLKGSLIFGAIAAAANNLAIYSFSSVISICINSALVGFSYRHFTTVIILYFSEKYPESASKLYSIATSGFIVTGCFWANMITVYINPENKEMTEVTYYNGYEERFFGMDVASRLVGVMNLLSVFTLSITLIMSFFFSDPEKYSSNFHVLLNWLKGEKVDLSRSIQQLSNHLSESAIILHTSRVESKENTIIANTTGVQLLDKSERLEDISQSSIRQEEHKITARQQAMKAFKTPKFWLLFYIGIFRLSLPCYYVDNAKIIGYQIVQNDRLIAQVYSVCTFLAMLSSALAGNVVERFGLLNCYIWSLVCNVIIGLLSATVIHSRPFVFLLLLAWSRVLANFNLQLSNITLFNCYEPDVALQLAKVYDLHGVMANFVMIGINQWLYVDGVITYVFLTYFLIDSMALLITTYKLRNYL